MELDDLRRLKIARQITWQQTKRVELLPYLLQRIFDSYGVSLERDLDFCVLGIPPRVIKREKQFDECSSWAVGCDSDYISIVVIVILCILPWVQNDRYNQQNTLIRQCDLKK